MKTDQCPPTTHSDQHWDHTDRVVIASRNAAARHTDTGRWVDAAVQVAEYQDQCTDLPIWTCDFSTHTGAKFYTVLGVDAFYRTYVDVQAEKRMYYELIRPTRPCKLYFDVEFPRHDAETRAKSMDEVCERIRERVCQRLVRDHGVASDQDVSVVMLDSSTESKASRHLVFTVRSLVFDTVLDVKGFVSMTFPGLQNPRAPDADPTLFCATGKRTRTGEPEVVHCVDGSVYSTNRSFRLWMSHKAGKPDCFHFLDKRPLNRRDFVDALITTFPRAWRTTAVRRVRLNMPPPTFHRHSLLVPRNPHDGTNKRPRINRRRANSPEPDALLHRRPDGTLECSEQCAVPAAGGQPLRHGRRVVWRVEADGRRWAEREEFYLEGRPVDTWREWHSRGERVWRIHRYREGQLYGECSEWDDQGRCVCRLNYRAGQLHGEQVHYHLNDDTGLLHPPLVDHWRAGQWVTPPERRLVYKALEKYYNRVRAPAPAQ